MCFSASAPLQSRLCPMTCVMVTASCSPHMNEGIGIGVAEGSDKDGMVEVELTVSPSVLGEG